MALDARHGGFISYDPRSEGLEYFLQGNSGMLLIRAPGSHAMNLVSPDSPRSMLKSNKALTDSSYVQNSQMTPSMCCFLSYTPPMH